MNLACDALRWKLKSMYRNTFDAFAPRYLGYVQDRDVYIAAFDAWRTDEDENIHDASFALYCRVDPSCKNLRILYIDEAHYRLCEESGSVLEKLPDWAHDSVIVQTHTLKPIRA